MGKYWVVMLLLGIGCTGQVLATHNRAGEITIRQTGDLTIEVTVTTYTKTTSTQADRDSVLVMWGDGSAQFVYRANGDGTPLPNNRKLNYYIASHTYPGRATYTISMGDPNRNGGILNVNPPNSEGVPFYLEATYTFLNPQFQGYNNTATLLQPPIDFACVGKRYIHNPNAYDSDGDSLSFEFIVPLQDSAVQVPNYILPTQIGPGPDNVMTLDPVTGDIVWQSPKIAGEYNIAFRVNEYRNGVLISSFIRDMQILVLTCTNLPPLVEAIDEVCVIAGQPLDLPIQVSDPDAGQLVAVSAAGGPYEIEDNPAMLFSGGGGFQTPPYQARLFWVPGCEQIREQPYTVIIKAVDNFLDTTGLVDLHAIRIRVVGPPPEGLAVQSGTGSLLLSWDLPYICDQTDDDYFKGFSVWRRKGSNQFVADTCETGLAGRGYQRIVANWKEQAGGRYAYTDTDLDEEGNYCYRLLAEFARTTPSGQSYLRVVSIPSAEVCIRTRADLPLLTKVSVTATDPVNGVLDVQWIGPDPTSLDTMAFPGPYRYELTRANGIDGTVFVPVPGGTFTSPTFSGLLDREFTLEGLDTRSDGHRINLLFYTGNSTVPYGSAPPASSIFLTVAPSDQSNILSWREDVPWDNYLYEIWRSTTGGQFEQIGTTPETTYRDSGGLDNGVSYCYRVVGLGDYGIDGVETPLINQSQEACGTPIDNVAPCQPNLSVTNNCHESETGTPGELLTNKILWQTGCGGQDIAYFILYYAQGPGSPWVEIARPGAADNTWEHSPGETIAGCYAISAVDASGNQSTFSTPVCVENCPIYELPNAFTPNGDGRNDLFRPLRARFIDRVDFKVFNQWGQVVFTTNDPLINWDGLNLKGKAVSDGVYFYTCEAFEPFGGVPFSLSGYIELIRG